MTKRHLTPVLLALMLSVAMPLPAQETEGNQDPGFLERMIQNALGGEGRDVRIIGLEGALSAEVRIAAIEVADPDGTWLTIRDVTMNWRRLALLRRQVEIDSLVIGAVELARAPLPAPAEPPSIEAEETPAQPFALPELPVSIQLGDLQLARLDLGQPILGQAAALSVGGAAQLAGGEGSARLNIDRIDGPEGRIDLDAGFENATRRLFVQLDVEEAEGGLIASLAKFPGTPSLDLSVAGDAPLSDFRAEIELATDGAPRLAGAVTVAQTGETGQPVVTTIGADLGGDITPLFVPEYHDFFGPDVGLTADIRLDAAQGTEIRDFTLSSRALQLSGKVGLLPSGLPRLVDIKGQVGTGDGQPVTLPVPGAETEVLAATLAVDYDEARGNAFTGALTVDELAQGALRVADTDLTFDGTLTKTAEPLTVEEIASRITARLAGITTGDAAVDGTLQPVEFTADLTADPQPGTVAIRNLALTSGDLALDGSIDVAGLSDGQIRVSTDSDLRTGDLARFAPLTGQALAGSLTGALTASYAVLTGAFDVTLDGAGQDLAIGNPTVDPLIGGAAQVGLTASRSSQGIRLDRLQVATPQISAQGTGALSSTSAQLDLDAELAEAGILLPQLSGPLTLSADAEGLAPDFKVALALGGAAITDQLGDPVALSSDIRYGAAAGSLSLSNLVLDAGDLTARGSADIAGLKADAPSGTAALSLATGDLARFAQLSGLPLTGTLDADLRGGFDLQAPSFDVTLTGQGQDIAIGNPQLDPLLAGTTVIDIDAAGRADALTIRKLDIHNPQLSATGAGTLSEAAADLTLTARLNEINPFLPHLDGPVALEAKAQGTAPDFTVILDASGAAITDKLGAPLHLSTDLTYRPEHGRLDIPALALTAGDLAARGTANVTGLDAQPAARAKLTLDTGNLSRLAGLTGMPLRGTLRADLAGGYDTASGDFDGTVTGRGQDIAIGNPQADQLLDGTTRIDAALRSEAGTITIERLSVDNPDVQVSGQGSYAAEGGTLDLNARLADLGLFVPQLRGPLTVQGNARGAGSAWTVDLGANGPSGLRATVAGDVSPTAMDLDIDAGLATIAGFVPQLPGPARVAGKVTGNGTDYFVDVNATAPAGVTARIDGRAWGPEGTSDLAITGRVPLQVADPFITPRSLTGTAAIDLALQGPPALNSLSGKVAFAGGRFTDPTSRIVLEQMALDLTFAQSRANLDFSSNLSTGGRITVSGPVALTAPYDGNIVVALQDLVVVDPNLYTINADGRITLAGPLAGGASITGRIDIPRAEIQIPNAIGGGGAIPDMTHVKEPKPSFLTRQRAGLVKDDAGDGSTGAPVAYPLDILISAPARIFVRGRGLDTEFGGQVQIGGTTQRIIPSGRFEVIRGRLDILARVLTFETAEITLGGDLVPDLYMIAVSEDAAIDARIQIEGPVNNPELTFSSTPTLPEDEVLAQLFFGKPIRELSPLEIAQLLSAINTLTGGGGGLFGKLREGFGVDQLNVGSDDEGNTEVTAGKYLTDDVYTDVTVGAAGTSRIRLNYELTPSLTARGGFDSEGDTRLGLSFEKDY